MMISLSRLNLLLRSGLLASIICAIPASASAQIVSLTWDAVPESAASGYVLYVGTASGVYSETYDVGNRTTFAYAVRQPQRTYFFSVAAYATDRVPGQRSSELIWSGVGDTAVPSSIAGAAVAGRESRASESSNASSTVCSITLQTACLPVTRSLRTPALIDSMAVANDGRIFIVEDGRRVRVATAEGWRNTTALETSGVVSIGGIALDPAFEANHYLYVGRIEARVDGQRELSVLRYREVQDVLGEGVVIIPGIMLPREGTAPFTIGATGHLYLAVPGPDRRSGDPYAATVLKFNLDGSVPSDNRAMTPVFAEGYARPVAVTAVRGGHELWMTAVDIGLHPWLARLQLTGNPAIWPRIPAAAPLGDPSDPPVGLAMLSPNLAGDSELYVATTKILYQFGQTNVPANAYSFTGMGALRSVATSAGGGLYVAASNPNDAGSTLMILGPQSGN